MITARDKYDEAIEYLTQNPHDIERAWDNPNYCKGGCLFQFAGKGFRHLPPNIGCLTSIRCTSHKECAGRPDLTERIRNDERIPLGPRNIAVSDLPVFAEWQRILDKELGRV